MNKIRLVIVSLFLCSPLFLVSVSNADMKPADYPIKGEAERKDGWITARAAASVRVPLPATQDIIRIRGKSGAEKAGLRISLHSANEKPVVLHVTAQALRAYWGQQKGKSFPEASLQVQWPGGRGGLFVRPNLLIYNEEKRAELSKAWETLPAASAHPFNLELRRVATALQVWLDGQFIGEMPLAAAFTQCEIALSPGAALQVVETSATETGDGILPLPIAEYSRPGMMEGAQIQIAPGVKLPSGLASSPLGASIDVGGLGRIPAASIDLQSYFWRHSALDTLPEARLFSVPLATYSHVDLLCAVDNDPAKTPSFTARLTRYGRSRGDAMADTTVTLPAENAPDIPSTRRVGTVTYGPANARRSAPLWLVRVPLPIGEIQDLLYDDQEKNALMSTHRYLEFELLDPLHGVEAAQQFPFSDKTERTYNPGTVPHYRWNAQRDSMTKVKFLPNDKSSSVHVFGAALQESPAALDVRANVPFLVFYDSDKPELRANVTAREAGKYSVQWEFADVDGKIVVEGQKEMTLAAPQVQETVAVPVKTGNGWYATRFRLCDANGAVLVEHRSSFVFLPPDTRKAGFESPFGTWWFHWAHGGEPNLEKVGPLLQRAGLRHTQLPEDLPESVTQKYGVTAWMIPWLRKPKGNTLVEKLAEHEELIRKYQTLWPSVDKMMIWHESGDAGAPFPSELHNATPKPLDEKSEKAWQERVEYITTLAKMVRAKYPHLKMQYGNNGNSIRSIGELLRRNFPREYIDAIATEDLGQVIIPERWMLDSLQSAWFLRETARKLGYDDLPSTAAYEWLGRRAPSTGNKDQAEWYARDALHALAYGFTSIPLGLIHDTGGGYFHSIWGASGLTRRYPVMEPRPSYASFATLTRVLDGAKFEREISTKFLSLYVLEFRRGDDWVYAFWTPRGQREVKLRLSASGRSTLTDLYGREKSRSGMELDLTVTTAPQYLTTSTRLSEAIGGAAAFPEDAPPSKVFTVDAMEKTESWELDESTRYDRGGDALPRWKKGEFELREVNDAQMGPCLELELKAHGEVGDLTHEYVFLKLKQPVSIPSPYDNIGIWVKGNGGWGEVRFVGQGENGNFRTQDIYYQNWSGQNAISFEGWNFLRYPLNHDYRWGGKGTITGLLITMPRKTLHLTELQPVSELKIRLKGISMF